MAKYVSLINWTDQGVRNAAETVQRAEDAQKLAANMGGSIEVLWTMGQYDIVGIAEFPDDETAAKFMTQVSAAGNIRTQTMRAFEAADLQRMM
jgi:uncharacterized protein with GYD domain